MRIATERLDQGRRLFQSGDYELCITKFTEAISLNPRSTYAYRYRAEAYRGIGMWELAKADAEQEMIIEAERQEAEKNRSADLRRQDNEFRIALACAAIPLAIPSLLIWLGLAFEGYLSSFIWHGSWYAVVTLLSVDIMAVIGFAIASRFRIVGGILAGIAVGVLGGVAFLFLGALAVESGVLPLRQSTDSLPENDYRAW